MPRPPRLAVVALLAAGLFARPTAASPPSPRGNEPARPGPSSPTKGIEARTLRNGMNIIVCPDHDVPNLALYTYYRVGSRNERPGLTGISHFFEHMMFNGSEHYPPGEFDRIMENAGGSNNAYTSTDVTVYQDWIPRSALETALRLEADRICCLTFDSTSVESERGVVYSERRTTTDDVNEAVVDEQVQSAAFLAHPYHIPIIGWPSDIEQWSIDDLRTYFRTYYAPNNATMIVSGDITPKEFFALAERYLEPIPAQEPPPAVRTVEPPQEGERRLIVRRPGQVPYIQAVFHRGRANDADAEALDLLSTILTGGESSRLYRRLVDQDQVAVSVYDYMLEGFDPGLYRLLVTVSPQKGVAACEAALLDELARVGREGVTDAELTKAKNVQLADFWRRVATIAGKASVLGEAEVFRGDWREGFTAPERYARVTADEVRSLARSLFDEKNRTIGILHPEPEPDAAGTEGDGR
jgi:zinc protease